MKVPTMPSRFAVFIRVWGYIVSLTMYAGMFLGFTFGIALILLLFTSSLEWSISNLAATASSMFFGLPIALISLGALGTALGGLMGIVVGGSTGLVVASISVIWFFPPRSGLVYRFSVHLTSLVAVTATMYFAFGFLIRTTYPEPLYSFFALLPIILSSMGSYWVIQRLTYWYAAHYFPTPSSQV